MGLQQLELETGLNKVEVAFALLKAWEPPEGYYLAFSGGKDSVAIYDLAVKDEGFNRLGCVLCPFSRQIEREEKYFPKIVANWKRACERIDAERKANNYLTRRSKPVKHRFETGEELYQWWVKRD